MKKIRYIYYDKTSGQIKDIVSKRKRGRGHYIEYDSKNEIITDLIMGKKGVHDYLVAYRKDVKEYDLVKKENIIKLRSESSKLYKIPKSKKNTDLKILYFPDNIIEVSLDMSNLTPLYMTDFKKEIEFEKGTEFRVIIKEKDKVLETIVIDGQNLMRQGVLFFKLPDTCFSSNVNFYTYKLLNTYSWSIEKEKIKSPIKENIKYSILKASNTKEENTSYHLVIQPSDNGITIQNNIKDLELLRIHGYVEFFITDKYDPNILHEKFILTEEDLKNNSIVKQLNKPLGDKSILYNHKYISVLVERA